LLQLAPDGGFHKELPYAPLYRVGLHPPCATIHDWQSGDSAVVLARQDQAPGDNPGTRIAQTITQRNPLMSFFLGPQTKWTETHERFSTDVGKAELGVGRLSVSAQVTGSSNNGGVVLPASACPAEEESPASKPVP